MPIKSRHLTTIASLALALALLGLFFVAGTRPVRAEEDNSEVVAETTEVAAETTPVSEPVIEETKVDTEAATVTEESAVGPEVSVEEASVMEETGPEIVPASSIPASIPVVTVASAVSLFAISDEFGGTSPTAIDGGSFTTDTASESFFTTSGLGGATSGEDTLTTPADGESSFTTLPSGSGPGCITNCGGGGGSSSGGGSFVPSPTISIVPSPCPLYLREFIHIGRANNPLEVRKLQAFLNVFMGENLAITGFYNQADFDAVSRFQARYLPDVLTPWGIDESTGYVFITTRLAINNIYCNRSTANDLDLRNYYPTILDGAQNQGSDVDGLVLGSNVSNIVPTSTPTVAASSNLFQVAALGLLNFFKFNPGGALIGLLTLAILFMFFIIWKLSKYPDTQEPEFDAGWPLVGTTDFEDEVVIEDDPGASLETTDEDPTQPSLTG